MREAWRLKHNGKLGAILLLTRGVDFEAKKLLTEFPLILKSDSSLLLIRRAGIIGNFFSL